MEPLNVTKLLIFSEIEKSTGTKELDEIMAKRKEKTFVEEKYERYFNYVQVNMMSIPEIYKDIEEVGKGIAVCGDTVEETDAKMYALVEKWRVK